VGSGGPGLVPLLLPAVLLAKTKDKRLLIRRLKSALEERGVMEGPGAVMDRGLTEGRSLVSTPERPKRA